MIRSLLFFLITVSAAPVLAAEMDYGLYLRTSAGTNADGGKQILLQNPGSSGNEFRLGNESTYSEVTFTGHALKTEKDQPFFDATMTFVYNPEMNSQYGDTTNNTDYVQVVQAFIKGGNLPDVPYTLWAGKRFYRDVSAYMDDFFYFADMSGVGAGVDQIKMGNGHLAFAYLQKSDNDFRAATNGAPAKQALDVRWRDIQLNSKNVLHAWAAVAYSSPGNGNYVDSTGTSTPTTYEAASGVVGGLRHRHLLSETAYNDAAFIWGNGNMATLTLESAPAFAKTGVYDPGANRYRLVDNIVTEIGDRWGIEGVLVYEQSDSGKATDSKTTWYSAGVRPHYKWSDHIRFTLEAGMSNVEVESERNTNGDKAGNRTLTRVTFAPELIVGKAFHARPILRAYVTHTAWNGANADTGNTGSMLGKLKADNNNEALIGERETTQYGFQGEIWF